MQAQMNKKILEINPSHPLIKALLAKVETVKEDNPEAKLDEDITDLLSLMTQGALIQSGYSLDDPLDFNQKLFRSINTLAGVAKDAKVQDVHVDLEDEDDQEEVNQEPQDPQEKEILSETLNVNQDSKEDL